MEAFSQPHGASTLAPEGATRAADVPHVLRYWLAMIRHEEALGRTLRVALAPRHGDPDVAAPSAGQAYIKLLPDALVDLPAAARRAAADAFLLRRCGELTFPVTDERAGFLEHALDRAYRKERAARYGQDEGEEGAHVVGFPTLHFAHKGELATLLRFPIGLPEWRDEGGAPWAIPRYKDRSRGRTPTAPARLRLVEAPVAADDDAVSLPYALDTHHASRTLGVPEEHVSRLLLELGQREGLTPEAMVAAVTALLHAPDDSYPEEAVAAAVDTPDGPGALLTALHEAVAARTLPSGVRVFPLAVAWDASQAMTTRGLQQDLRALAMDPPLRTPDSPLGAYLHGAPTAHAEGLHLGLRGPHPLTPEQRQVADRALRQRLVCAQGPPGTGKTELILNLAAHVIVAAVAEAEPKSDPSPRRRPPLVVSSTNNRAVDNVIDPLARDLDPARLPLALRVGSLAVIEEVTGPTLQRALAWLAAGNAAGARERWLALQAEVAVERQRLLSQRGEARAAASAVVALPAAQARLAAVAAAVAGPRARLGRLGGERADAVRAALALGASFAAAARHARERLEGAGDVGPTRVKRVWKKLNKAHAPELKQALGALGVGFVAPREPAQRARWEEAFDALETALEGVAADVWRLTPGDEVLAIGPLAFGALDAECGELEAEVARLERALAGARAGDPAVREAALAEAEGRLFARACEAREAWALSRRDVLVPLLTDLTAPGRARGGFKVKLQDDEVRAALFGLFPVVGCTLLSLGNVFPLEPDVIGLSVIDEAGQCHPAYAVSALARSARALVIGDPHQLEPVIGLDDAEEERVLRRTGCLLTEAALAPVRATAEAGRSAQTLAARACGEVLMLRDHFRCQAPIIAVSDALCRYGLRVRTPLRSLSDRTRYLSGPLLLHDVRGEQTPRAGSWANEAEVERVSGLVRALLRDGIGAGQIAVLTPYRGQLVALRARFKRDGVPMDDDFSEAGPQGLLFDEGPPGALALGTVHRFQGGERDVVIFSTVVTRERSLGFTNRKVNLVNVAVSRARLHLVVVGHGELLERGEITRILVRAVPAAQRFLPNSAR